MENADSVTNPGTLAGSTSGGASSSLSSGQRERVKQKFDEYSTYTSRWSGAYWGSVFGATILSGLAGIVLKLDALKDETVLYLSQSDLAALLAGVAALLIAVSSGGDFAGKWKANRTAKNRAEQLNIELDGNPPTADEVKAKLMKIVDDQNNGVINFQDPPP